MRRTANKLLIQTFAYLGVPLRDAPLIPHQFAPSLGRTNPRTVSYLLRGVSRLPGLKVIYHLVHNLKIILLEGPDSLINFALSIKIDEHLSLPRPGRRIREELEK